MAEDGDGLDTLEFLRDVRANTDISASLPLHSIDAGNTQKINTGVAKEERATSTTQTTNQLRAMGLFDRQLDGASIPCDPQLPISQVLGDADISRLAVDWDGPWLPYLQIDEVLLRITGAWRTINELVSRFRGCPPVRRKRRPAQSSLYRTVCASSLCRSSSTNKIAGTVPDVRSTDKPSRP